MTRASPASSSVIIRPMNVVDREAVARLIHELNLAEAAISDDRRREPEAGLDCLVANEARVAREGGAHFVAESGGRVVGYLCCVFEEGPAYLLPEKRAGATIAELVVTEACRRQGIGAALATTAAELATSSGRATLTIGALAGNAGAIRLYERLGFRPSMLVLSRDL